eukprot:scaffold450359_cov38-Prasinocladus_malaysianus.AAC.2
MAMMKYRLLFFPSKFGHPQMAMMKYRDCSSFLVHGLTVHLPADISLMRIARYTGLWTTRTSGW